MAMFAYLPPKRKFDNKRKEFVIRHQNFIAGDVGDNLNYEAHIPYLVLNIAFLPDYKWDSLHFEDISRLGNQLV